MIVLVMYGKSAFENLIKEKNRCIVKLEFSVFDTIRRIH